MLNESVFVILNVIYIYSIVSFLLFNNNITYFIHFMISHEKYSLQVLLHFHPKFFEVVHYKFTYV